MPEYIIKDFKVAGDPFESKAGKLQGFWIQLTGGQSALWNKKVDGGPPQPGPVWGDLIEETSKAGKKYFKFKKGQADSTPPHHVATTSQSGGQLDRMEQKLDLLIKAAGLGVTEQQVKAVFDDERPPISNYDEQVNVEELPF